jgi:putative membrane protein
MKFLRQGLLIATTALLLTALGFAQSSAAAPDQYGNDVFQTADPQFMREAAQDAMAKIHLAYLALQNAQNEQVKLFAQQILNDYGKAQADLFNLANQQFVVLPNTLDPKNLDTFEALSQLHGAAFDKAYVKAMLNDDQTTLSRFKREATNGDDWASHTLPRLESDLKEAQKVAPVVGIHSTVTREEQRTPSASKPINAVSQEP